MGDGGSNVGYVSFSICWFSKCVGIFLWYMFLVHALVMFWYMYMYMDVNTSMNYVIKLQ